MGAEELALGDRALLAHNVLGLMDKSLAYKKSWLARIWAARQRARRIATRNQELTLQTKEASLVYQWCLHHREQPKRKKRPGEDRQDVEEGVEQTNYTKRRRRTSLRPEMMELVMGDNQVDGPQIEEQEYCAQIVAGRITPQRHQTRYEGEHLQPPRVQRQHQHRQEAQWYQDRGHSHHQGARDEVQAHYQGAARAMPQPLGSTLPTP
jgi:hypothetical protein